MVKLKVWRGVGEDKPKLTSERETEGADIMDTWLDTGY